MLGSWEWREKRTKDKGGEGKPFGGELGGSEIAGRPKAKGKAARWDVGVPAAPG